MISLVIPLYNKSERIEACLGSVLSQSSLPTKIVVVDDGSKDDSALKAEQIAQDQPKIQVIRQDNAGVSVARNVGLQAVETPFVAFLDADDVWHPDFIARARELITLCPEANLYGFGHKKFDPNIGEFAPLLGLSQSHCGYVDDYFVSASKGPLVNSSSVVVRRSALLDIGGFPEGQAIGEDLYTWAQLVLNAPQATGMAFDGRTSSLIYQVEDQSREGRDKSLPFVMAYFASDPTLVSANASLKAYLWRISWLHVLGAIETGHTMTARNRARLVRGLFGIKGWLLWILARLSNPLLQFALSHIKQRRRRGRSAIIHKRQSADYIGKEQ